MNDWAGGAFEYEFIAFDRNGDEVAYLYPYADHRHLGGGRIAVLVNQDIYVVPIEDGGSYLIRKRLNGKEIDTND